VSISKVDEIVLTLLKEQELKGGQFFSNLGDAKNLSDFTYIPAIVWSIALLLLVGYIAYQTLNLFPCMESGIVSVSN